VLAIQPRGSWGYLHGLNEKRVAVGVANWQSCLSGEVDRPGLLGPELVRLVLECGHSARHALDVLTDLITRHGQARFSTDCQVDDGDHVFLIADGNEAFAVEAAGSTWAAQEIAQVRAASDVAVLRQDWSSLAAGLADNAIAEGWWSPDGSKFDFAGVLSECPTGKASALRRWGRMTVLAEQQNGHIDTGFLRRLLADHYEGTHFEADPLEGPPRVTPVCHHPLHGAREGSAAGVLAQIPEECETACTYWVAMGPPCLSVHFPLFLEGDLPPALGGDLWERSRRLADFLATDSFRWLRLRTLFGLLQGRFDQDTEELLQEATHLTQRGEQAELRRLAASMMQSHVERYEEAVHSLLAPERSRMPVQAAAMAGELHDF